jgi:adenosylmethionine-8-amino-7-oxononanoate aminotransferase
MAYQYWQFKKEKRTIFLSLKNAYHGDTIGAVSVGGTDLFHTRFKSLLFKSYFAMSPYCYRCSFRTKNIPFPLDSKNFKNYNSQVGCKGECIKQVEEILSKHSKQIVAAIIEPLNQATSGMIVMPKGYLFEYARLCKKYDVLLICDEVATGFGRTGRMFAVEHENIKPDFLCLSKGITGGYLPLAITTTTNKIYNAFLGKYEEFKTFFHGHSYTANPLACAAANAVIDILEKDNTFQKINTIIKHLEEELKGLLEHVRVGNVRQCGLMVGIEIVEDKKTGKSYNCRLKTGAKVCNKMRTHGIIIRNLNDTLVLFLPLIITKSEISKIIKVIKMELDNL